jgi:hypothetical protein
MWLRARRLILYEIKSSTSAKLDHEYDLALQLMVLEGCGYSVRNIAVIHVDNNYVRQGEIDAGAICATTDVTEAVREKLADTKLDAQKAYDAATLTSATRHISTASQQGRIPGLARHI